MAAAGADGKPAQEAIMTEVGRPVWLDTFCALTGIDTLQDSIRKENEKRSEDFYEHAYPEIHAIVTSTNFELVMGSFILTNTIFLGMEASDRKGEQAAFFDVFEHFFTGVFLIEWSLRLLAFGWTWLFVITNAIDTVLVWVPGVLLKWVLIPFGLGGIGGIRIFTVLRSLRLARLARAVRLFPAFKEMWLLVRGLITSLQTLFWTMVIVLCVIYVFAIIATEIIGKSEKFLQDDFAQELFGDLLKSMFTMFQLMTLDTWADTIARPLMETKPELGLFFIFFVTVAVFVLMNLITAVIVENAFAIAKEDQEAQAKANEMAKRKELKDLAELFKEIDLDGSNCISHKEFLTALKNPKVATKLMLLEMTMEDIKKAWELLDDGDGELDIEEFTGGIRRMKGEAKSKDILDVVRRTRTSFEHMKGLDKMVKELELTVSDIHSDAADIGRDVKMAHGIFAEIARRFEIAAKPPTPPLQRLLTAEEVRQMQEDEEDAENPDLNI